MINQKEFTARIQMLIDHYQLSSSAFAENIGVQRSAISHIMSGRNKPSLDFIMKVLKAFPEVEIHWLLNGKGNPPGSFQSNVEADSIMPSAEQNQPAPSLFPEASGEVSQEQPIRIPSLPEKAVQDPSKKISRIIICYSDHSFEEYTPG